MTKYNVVRADGLSYTIEADRFRISTSGYVEFFDAQDDTDAPVNMVALVVVHPGLIITKHGHIQPIK